MSAVDVLAVLAPGSDKTISRAEWKYDRTTLRDCPDADVSDEVFRRRREEMVHRYEAAIRCVGERPTVYVIEADKLDEARAAVAELMEAIKESREATQEFANDGQPENYARYINSEDRIVAALARCKGEGA